MADNGQYGCCSGCGGSCPGMGNCNACPPTPDCNRRDQRASSCDPVLDTHCGALGNCEKYYPEKIVDELAGSTVPMINVFKGKHGHILEWFFDYTDIPQGTNPGAVTPQFVLKNIGSVKMSTFVDGNYIQWGEYHHEKMTWYVTQDYTTPTCVIEVGLPDGNGGYIPTTTDQASGYCLLERATILVHRKVTTPNCDTTGDGELDSINECCLDVIQKTIVAKTNTTIELECLGEPGFTFSAGDCIQVLWKSRNDCELINNKYGKQPITNKKAYVQHFGYELCFKKCDLNKSYRTEDGAMGFITREMRYNNLHMAEEIANASLLGRGRGGVCCGEGELPAEMNGIITEILKAHTMCPEKGIVSSFKGLCTEEARVKKFFCELIKAQTSGVLNQGEKLTVLTNTSGGTFYQQMSTAFGKALGYHVFVNDRVNGEMIMPEIATPSGGIELVQTQLLDYIFGGQGVFIMFPKRLLSVVARENYKYDVASGRIEKQTMGMMIEEKTQPGQHECRCWDVWTECGLIAAAVCSGAYRMITGAFPSC